MGGTILIHVVKGFREFNLGLFGLGEQLTLHWEIWGLVGFFIAVGVTGPLSLLLDRVELPHIRYRYHRDQLLDDRDSAIPRWVFLLL